VDGEEAAVELNAEQLALSDLLGSRVRDQSGRVAEIDEGRSSSAAEPRRARRLY
jgi:hypothetical protein